MKVSEIRTKVYVVECKTRFDLCSTFMRMQEFYESPFKEIRGQYFSHEECIDHYAKHNPTKKNSGKFTYFDDWSGFNIPGDVFVEWWCVFKDRWNKEERVGRLIEEMNGDFGINTRFYVIGVFEKDKHKNGTIKHELAHAYWYIYPEYQNAMKKFMRKLDPKLKKLIKTGLKAMGYNRSVHADEMHAYLVTSPKSYMKKWFKVDNDFELPKEMVSYFKEFDKEQKER